MRTKKEFSFDELKDAEKVLLEGMPSGIDYGKIYLVAKYFRQTYRYGAVRLEKELVKYCLDQDPNFNPVIEAQAIKKWVKVAMSYGLRKIDSVSLSNKEIDFLKSVEPTKDRKVLFAILVFCKVLKKNSHSKKTSEYYYIRYSNFMDIIRITKLGGLSEVDVANIIHKHKKHFTLYNPEKELIRIDYVDTFPESQFIIDRLDSIAGYYEMLFGERKGVGVCKICHRTFIKNSNRQEVCLSCRKTQNRLKVQKFRNKKL
jgi:hypothetical protein